MRPGRSIGQTLIRFMPPILQNTGTGTDGHRRREDSFWWNRNIRLKWRHLREPHLQDIAGEHARHARRVALQSVGLRQIRGLMSKGTEREVLGALQPEAAGWLVEHGPKELELLFRAIVFHPSAPILLTDNNRHHRDASVGAGKLLGLPRDEIIGRSLDDFADPSFKPVISARWRAFLKDGQQEGTLKLLGPDGDAREVEYLAKGNVLPARHLLVVRDKTNETPDAGPAKVDKAPGTSSVPAWVQDYALFLLDVDGQIVAWYAGAERIYGYKSGEVIGEQCRAS